MVTIRHTNKYYSHRVGTYLWENKQGLFDSEHEYWINYKEEHAEGLREYFGVDESHEFSIVELLQYSGLCLGKNTGEMAKLASELHKVDGDYNELAPEWKAIFQKHMTRKKINKKKFIKFLTELRDSRVGGGKTTGEMAKLASVLDKVKGDYNKLSSEWKFIFELHMARKGIDKDEFIKFLTELRDSRAKGGKTSAEMNKLASVLDDDEVDGDYNKLSPEWKFIFELHMARKGIDEDELVRILMKMHSKTGKTSGEMKKLASKLFSTGGDDLSPEWQFIFDLHMARKKMDETSFKSFLQKIHETNNFKSGKTDEEYSKQCSINSRCHWDKVTQKEIRESNGWAVTLSCPNKSKGCSFTRTKGLKAYNKMKERMSNPTFTCKNCKFKRANWAATKPFKDKVKDDSSKQTTLSEPTKKKKKKKTSTDTSQKKTITTTKRKKTTSTTKKSSTNRKNDSSTTTKKMKIMNGKGKRKTPTANTSTQPTNAKKQKTEKKER